MIRPALIALALVALGACREDRASLPEPVAMTEEAVGHFCQMELLEHPGPKAQAHLSGMPYPLFFSQVRDVVAYQRMPEQSHTLVVSNVSDMGAPGATWDDPGAANWIAVQDAWYVVGSTVAGGMGASELVPFGTRAAAESFVQEHGGSVMRLGEIPDSAVLAPEEHSDTGTEADEAAFEARLRDLGSGADE